MRFFSFGGGRQTVACLVLAAQGKIDYQTFVFANVGDDSEYPGTLAYLKAIARPYAIKHGLSIEETKRVKRDGTSPTLYEHTMDPTSRSIPIPARMANGAPGNRSCTVDYKIKVISKWLKFQGANASYPATLGMGISLDEMQRARTDDSRYPHIHKEYPLIDLRLTLADCVTIIEKEGLPLPPKSACYFCPFKTIGAWQELKRFEPELFEKAAQLEDRINEKRGSLGRDRVYLSSRARPLRSVVSEEIQANFDDMPCPGDVCFV